MTYDELVDALMTRRRELKLSQRDVAERLGIAHGTYQRYEGDRRFRLRVATLERWAIALDSALELALRPVDTQLAGKYDLEEDEEL